MYVDFYNLFGGNIFVYYNTALTVDTDDYKNQNSRN